MVGEVAEEGDVTVGVGKQAVISQTKLWPLLSEALL